MFDSWIPMDRQGSFDNVGFENVGDWRQCVMIFQVSICTKFFTKEMTSTFLWKTLYYIEISESRGCDSPWGLRTSRSWNCLVQGQWNRRVVNRTTTTAIKYRGEDRARRSRLLGFFCLATLKETFFQTEDLRFKYPLIRYSSSQRKEREIRCARMAPLKADELAARSEERRGRKRRKKSKSTRASSCTSALALSPLSLSPTRGIVTLLRQPAIRLHCRYNCVIDRLDVFFRDVSYTVWAVEERKRDRGRWNYCENFWKNRSK